MDANIADMDGSEEIIIHNAYIYRRVPVSEVLGLIEMLKRRTRCKASTITTAMELVRFAMLPEDEKEKVCLLNNIIRCLKDGSVTPPFDIEELYASIALPP